MIMKVSQRNSQEGVFRWLEDDTQSTGRSCSLCRHIGYKKKERKKR